MLQIDVQGKTSRALFHAHQMRSPGHSSRAARLFSRVLLGRGWWPVKRRTSWVLAWISPMACVFRLLMRHLFCLSAFLLF